MDFIQKGNMSKCKTMHTTVQDKKGFIKDSNALRARSTCNFVSKMFAPGHPDINWLQIRNYPGMLRATSSSSQ